MQLTAWAQRIIREVEYGRLRYAVIGALLVVGATFWIPQLVQVSATSTSPQTNSTPSYQVNPRPAVEATTSFTKEVDMDDTGSAAVNSAHGKERPASSSAESLVDPVARSLEMVAVPGNPNRFATHTTTTGNSGQDVQLVVNVTSSENEDGTPATVRAHGLTVQDAIIGVQRRAAVVNDQLYFEGDTITTDTDQFRVVDVEKHRVTIQKLTKGNVKFVQGDQQKSDRKRL